jgi:Arc/MetJ-type ribon-helix-helix transcriptional regulator
MQLIEIEINIPDDFKVFARSEVRSGRYATVDEAVVHALYLLLQEQDQKGYASPESKAVLSRPLEQTLAEFRHALTEKPARSQAETWD